MLTRLDQILSHCRNGREIAVWGTPTRLMERELRGYPWQIAGKVDVSAHYVIAVTQEDLTDFERDAQRQGFRDVYDYVCFQDEGKELPFAWTCFGVPIGRQTYFGEGVADACENGYVECIGSYCSINGTASIMGNHQLGMLFTSDELPRFFGPENKARFDARCREGAGHPYALGKPRITIGNDVWIGANAFINCSKVTRVGDGAIIGAGAVVMHDVPPYAVVAGVPAKIIRYRYAPEVIKTLERVQWWHWSPEEIDQHADVLLSPEAFMRRFGGQSEP